MRALILAYYFPPIGGAGAQRSLKFVRYLPEHGYRIAVVTGPGGAADRWSPADETLLSEVPPEADIYRVPGPEPAVSTRWRGRAERWLGLERQWNRWWIEGAVSQGLAVGGVDFIYASMSPYSSAEAAATLARRLGKPWIASLRDPWALDEMTVYPSALHRHLELSRMRRLLESAAGIVMTAPEAVDQLLDRFPELAHKPVFSIPNGFDAADFVDPPPPREDGIFRIVHTGYLHTQHGRRQRRTSPIRHVLGGQTPGVDILTRSHVYLLQAIESLIARDPSLHSKIEVHLAGVLSADDREVGARSPVVRMLGYLPHAESVRLIQSADLLFLPMQNLAPGMRSSTVPGKTYEYLASRRPILAAVPEGDTRDIVEGSGNAYVCDPDDVDAMAQAIALAFQRWREGRPPPNAREEYLERFERRHLTTELQQALRMIISGKADAAAALPQVAKPTATATSS